MKREEILEKKVKERFGIIINPKNVHFINLDAAKAKSLDPKNYPTFTLFWQCLAFINVCIHAYNKVPCDVFVDTMGVGFGYPFVKLIFGVKIYSYTHYPIVS